MGLTDVAEEEVFVGMAEVGTAELAFSVALTETEDVEMAEEAAEEAVASPPNLGMVRVSMVLYVVPPITPVSGIVSTG